MTITLKGEIREGNAKLAEVRAQGFIPGVYYGHKQAATPCVFQMNEFKKVLKAAGESTVVTLEMPTGKVNALITEVQYDPVKGEPTAHFGYLHFRALRTAMALIRQTLHSEKSLLRFLIVSPPFVKQAPRVPMRMRGEQRYAQTTPTTDREVPAPSPLSNAALEKRI